MFAKSRRYGRKIGTILHTRATEKASNKYDGGGWFISRFLIFMLTAIALSPVFLVELPAMIDYPNHLARMHIIVATGTPDANPFYQVNWLPYPNLAVDILVPQMARIVGVETAMKSFLILSQLLVVSGAVALEHRIKGRVLFSGFASLTVIHCLPFEGGQLNFEFGLGIALWALTSWFAFERYSWAWRFMVHSAFVLILFAAHFFALGVYGATLGLRECSRVVQQRPLKAKDELRLLTMLIAPAAAVISLMLLSGGAIGGGQTNWLYLSKVI